MQEITVGSCYKVVHCKGAIASLGKALRSVTPAKKQKTMLINLMLQVERLSEGKRAPEVSIRSEAKLPSFLGKPAKNFMALKRIPIRGYLWESEIHEMTYFISHYIYKDFEDLQESDIQKVRNNWERIERGSDEN